MPKFQHLVSQQSVAVAAGPATTGKSTSRQKSNWSRLGVRS